MEYLGQMFGNRKVIRNHCENNDWLKLGLKIPQRTDKYVLTQCGNCGAIIPAMVKNLIDQPPKRCVFCSNIGNHSKVKTNTNNWAVYNKYAVCNVIYNHHIVSFFIDSDDYERVKKLTWRVSKKRQKYYIISGSYKKNTMVYLHDLVYGDHPITTEIDHIDGNSLNNRKSNLRAVSRQENIDNQRATRIDNKLGIRGIVYCKRTKNYKVDFNYHGIRFYTKEWNKIEEAVWCRYCFEDYFNLPAIKNNPLAEQYYSLDKCKKSEIRQYVLEKILRNERYQSLHSCKQLSKYSQKRI